MNLGAEVPSVSPVGWYLPAFFEQAELRDVLDTVTLVFNILKDDRSADENQWISHVRRVISEENLAYVVDDAGIVRPFIDVEFEANRSAALGALTGERFGEARQDFEAAYKHLRNGEGKQAIRMIFPSLEVAAKVLHPGAFARLMPNEVDRFLLPRLKAKYEGNAPALEAGQRLLEAFKDWIIASQTYRHGQEVREPADPPQDFVVAHLSTGAAFLRWMIELAE